MNEREDREQALENAGRNDLLEARRQRSRERLVRDLSVKTVFFQFALILVIAAFLLFVPRSKVSNIEKRELAKFPSFSIEGYFNGEFTTGITQFYDDTVPFRDFFKNAGNNIRSLFGLHVGDQVEVIGNINKVDEAADETTEPTVTEEVLEEELDNLKDYHAETAEGSVENGNLVVKQDGHWRGIQLFGGGSPKVFAESVNHLRSELSESIRIYVMPVPLQSEFYLPKNFSEYSADQRAFFEELYSELDSGIETVDVVDALSRHRDEAIYLRTDHHWQPLGAYYAAEQFAKVADVPFPALEDYEREDRDGYVGSLYAITKSANILNDPETFTLFYPRTESTTDYYTTSFQYDYTGDFFHVTDVANSYMAFMLGDDKIVKVTTNAGTGRNLLVIKDSYGNAELPFYFAGFDRICVIDPRYFDVNLLEFINTMEISDILITEDSYSLAGSDSADDIEEILAQNPGSALSDSAPTDSGSEIEDTETGT